MSPVVLTCPQCEERPVRMRKDGRKTNTCLPCETANHALLRYWTRIGMPLSWDDARPRMVLAPIRRVLVA